MALAHTSDSGSPFSFQPSVLQFVALAVVGHTADALRIRQA